MKVLLTGWNPPRGGAVVPAILSWCLALAAAAAGIPLLLAQNTEETCVIALKGQNQNRTVDGFIDAECEPVTLTQWHDPPWGNWGVSSNYGRKNDTDQFKGWKPKGSQHHWNSCTAWAQYAPPNSDYYNSSDHRSQESDDTATHGVMEIRQTVSCPDPSDPNDDPPAGCSTVEGWRVTQRQNYMTIYELDSPDRDELIETLYFPGMSVTLRSCDHDGCPERTSSWVDMSRSTNSDVQVDAELRMKASAQVFAACDWNW